MSKLEQEVVEFKRGLLQQRLAQCTECQRANFARIFQGGVSDDKLDSTIALCDRTIAANANKLKEATR